MNTKDHALDLALEALEESVDLVREDYENAKKLYSNYPSRQARLLGLEDGLSKHEAAITAIKQARSAPVQEPVEIGDTLFRQFMSEADNAAITHWPTPPGGRQSEDCLTAATVPDALTDQDPETPEYREGWNDCRAFMLNWRNNQ